MSANPIGFNLQNPTFTASSLTNSKNTSSLTSKTAHTFPQSLEVAIERQVWSPPSAGGECASTKTSSPSQHRKEHLKKVDFTSTTSTPLGAAVPRCFCKHTHHTSPGFGLSCQRTLFRSHKETCDITCPLSSPFPPRTATCL